jgi:metal-responsive CopG/Arc/MetJ family transcriptional regulator
MPTERFWTVTVDRTLIEPIDKAIQTAKNEFGGQLYDSRSDFVNQAIIEKLRTLEVTA